jgi:epoxyqueuosine reductase
MSHTIADKVFKATLREQVRKQGFADVRVAPATISEATKQTLEDWLAQGFHGEMLFMERTRALRADPNAVLPGARSVLVFRADYYPHVDRPQAISDAVRVAKYALGKDYHFVLRERLAPVLEWLNNQLPGHQWRVAIDSAPVLERAYAALAGIGFFGRNTMIIAPRVGSYFFLALVFTTAEIEPDEPIAGTCGTCRRCLDACPTQAFVAPYVLDARRCISYLTIEKKTPLCEEEKQAISPWIFGCDICQDVCPYNKRPPLTPFEEFRDGRIVSEFLPPSFFLDPPSSRALARRLAGSPLLRAGARRLRELARWFLEKKRAKSAAQSKAHRPVS